MAANLGQGMSSSTAPKLNLSFHRLSDTLFVRIVCLVSHVQRLYTVWNIFKSASLNAGKVRSIYHSTIFYLLSDSSILPGKSVECGVLWTYVGGSR